MHTEIAIRFPQFTMGGEAVTGHDPVHWHDVALCHAALRVLVDEEESQVIPDRCGDAGEVGRRKRPRIGPVPPNAQETVFEIIPLVRRFYVVVRRGAAIPFGDQLCPRHERVGGEPGATRTFHRSPSANPDAEARTGKQMEQQGWVLDLTLLDRGKGGAVEGGSVDRLHTRCGDAEIQKTCTGKRGGLTDFPPAP
jgi:hypothetical protein